MRQCQCNVCMWSTTRRNPYQSCELVHALWSWLASVTRSCSERTLPIPSPEIIRKHVASIIMSEVSYVFVNASYTMRVSASETQLTWVTPPFLEVRGVPIHAAHVHCAVSQFKCRNNRRHSCCGRRSGGGYATKAHSKTYAPRSWCSYTMVFAKRGIVPLVLLV